MATRISCNGVQLAVEDSGGGGPTVLFSHGLLYSLRMWDAQIAALRPRFRCIAYDHRGQGESEAPLTGLDMDTLTEDVAALIDTLGIGPVHFVGMSMGGFVGMRLAARRPELVRALVLIDTSAGPEPPANLPATAGWSGSRAGSGRARCWVGCRRSCTGRAPGRIPAAPRTCVRGATTSSGMDAVAMTRAVEGVLTRQSAMPLLPRIHRPTLVLVGEEDTATVPARSEEIAAGIPGARLVRIPRAGHMSPIDAPDSVTAQLRGFLEAQP